MIKALMIGSQPIQFAFSIEDIINIDEKKKVLILADSVTRTYKDTVSDGDESTEDTLFQNSFPTLRQVFVPYDGLKIGEVTLFDTLKDDILNKNVSDYAIDGQIEFISQSRIVVSDKGLTVSN